MDLDDIKTRSSRRNQEARKRTILYIPDQHSTDVLCKLEEQEQEIAQLKDKLQAWATNCRIIRRAK